MKEYKFYLLAGILGFITVVMGGCKEDAIGQTPVDNVPPGTVKNVVVENTPGGAIIRYDVPDDGDLLYVKAVYTLRGEEKTTSSSLFTNVLEIGGFGTTDEQNVQLICVDRSQNESEPVNIKINPLTPPIQSIFNSLEIMECFGGVQANWENETNTEIVLYLLVKDSIGDIREADMAFSSRTDGEYKFRGFENVEHTFGFLIRDRWDNFSDTLFGNFTPFFEEQLDKSLMKRKTLPGDNTTIYANDATYEFNKMFDNNTSSIWHTESGSDHPLYITIDLGVTAKLSRFKMWHRQGSLWLYDHHNLKYFTVFGCNETLEDIHSPLETDYWYWGGFEADWPFKMACDALKPSGLEEGVTDEDTARVAEGFEYDIPISAPPLRYIRIRIDETWSGGVLAHIAEFSFWGEVVNE